MQSAAWSNFFYVSFAPKGGKVIQYGSLSYVQFHFLPKGAPTKPKFGLVVVTERYNTINSQSELMGI